MNISSEQPFSLPKEVITTSYQEPPDEKEFVQYLIASILKSYVRPSILVFGILGNVLSIIVLLQRNMRSITTFRYMTFLALSDCVALVVMLQSWTGYHIQVNNDAVCKIFTFLFYFSIHFSVTILTVMTIERFIIVSFPLKSRIWISLKRTNNVIGFVSLFILALDGHNLFTRTALVIGGNVRCSYSWYYSPYSKYGYFIVYVYPWIDAFIYSFIPLTLIFIFNLLIILKLKEKSVISDSKVQGSCDGQSDSNTMRQVTIMLLTVAICFLVLTSPIAVILVVEHIWDPYQSDPLTQATYSMVRRIVNNMMYLNHAINFMLYMGTGTGFRRQLIKLVMCKNK